MIIDALNAWVLYRRWSGDTSAQVTFFTREQGIIQGLYKGGRTPKKQASLQAFIPLWLVINTRNDWHYVRQLEAQACPLPLAGKNLFAAIYLNELLYHALHPSDPHPELYDAYVQALNDLTLSIDRITTEKILRCFEMDWLTTCGYQILFSHESNGMPILKHNKYRYVPGEGFFVNGDKGILGSHLLTLAEGDLREEEILKTAKYIMRLAVHYALEGKPIKARELYGNKL